ncbi:hypothetical protein ES703_109998 [subsurface metagenome]
MKLHKAKEIIDHNIKEAGKKMPPDVKDALVVASSCISGIIAIRCGAISNVNEPLPGETED